MGWQMKSKMFVAIGITAIVVIALVGRYLYNNSAEANDTVSALKHEFTDNFDYDRLIHLDAENLFEQGMLDGYNDIIPKLSQFAKPAQMVEIVSDSTDDYVIEILNKQYYLFDDDIAQRSIYEGWALATYTIFHVVNLQMVDSDYKLYALYGANDLHGVFMTEEEVIERRRAFKDKHSEWPYIPTMEKPDFGFPGGGDDFWFGLGHSSSTPQKN